jgi:hypothetical protein
MTVDCEIWECTVAEEGWVYSIVTSVGRTRKQCQADADTYF